MLADLQLLFIIGFCSAAPPLPPQQRDFRFGPNVEIHIAGSDSTRFEVTYAIKGLEHVMQVAGWEVSRNILIGFVRYGIWADGENFP